MTAGNPCGIARPPSKFGVDVESELRWQCQGLLCWPILSARPARLTQRQPTNSPWRVADVLEVLQALVKAVILAWEELLTVRPHEHVCRSRFSRRLFPGIRGATRPGEESLAVSCRGPACPCAVPACPESCACRAS